MQVRVLTGAGIAVLVVLAALWFSDTLRIPTQGPSLASGADSIQAHRAASNRDDGASKPEHRPINPLQPMRLWIGGDSLAGALGPSLGEMTAATGVVQPQYDSRVGSGLISGDINWPVHAAEQLNVLKPEVVVFIIGTNDANVYDDSLAAEYAQKTEQMMRILAAGGREVYWVNAPVMRDEDLEAKVLKVNEIQREVATKVGVNFIDAHTLFADETGQYQSYLPDATGKKVLMRAGDGIHFTGAGGDHLAKVIFDRLELTWKINEQAVPSQPKRVLVTKGSTQVAGGGSSGSSGSSGSTSNGSSYRGSSSGGSSSRSGSSGTVATTPATAPPVADPPPLPSTTPTSAPSSNTTTPSTSP